MPDDLVEGWARLTGSLMTEAPTGELEREPEHADAAVVREAEALLARQGRPSTTPWHWTRSGEVVAFTDVATTSTSPGRPTSGAPWSVATPAVTGSGWR